MRKNQLKDFSRYLELCHLTLWMAIHHHRTHNNKRLNFLGHLYLKEILTDTSNHLVIKKSTQGGVSEVLIVKSWVKANQGRTVFYILPTDGLKNRFVTNRFEKSVSYTPYYRNVQSQKKDEDTNRSKIDNKSFKDINNGAIAFAGSKSEVPFVELPADDIIIDEADKCDVRQLEMAEERLGHCADPTKTFVGNPTYLGSFLDTMFEESTKSLWIIKGPCGHFIHPNFFDHVVKKIDEFDYVIRDKSFEFGGDKDIKPICDKCDKPFDRFSDGNYVSEKDSSITGKQINRVFSGTSPLTVMVNKFSKAQENDYKMQRFYNSELGESYTAEGSKVSSAYILKNTSDYIMPEKSSGPCFMGVDVGKVIHVKINKRLPDKRKLSVYIGVVNELSDVLPLIQLYNVMIGVIDALPEIRLSRKFSHSFNGGFRCFFGSDKNDSFSPKEKTITVSRLAAFDEVKENIVTGNLIFPKNIDSYEEYLAHMQEPTRVWDEERKVYSWINNRLNHFFLTEVYALVAERMIGVLK